MNEEFYDLRGHILTYSFRGVKISRARAIDALRDAGIDSEFLAKKSTRTGWSQAVKDLEDSKIIQVLSKDNKAKTITFQFNDIAKDGDGSLKYPYDMQVTLHTDTGDVDSRNEAFNATTKAKILEALDTLNANDLTRLIQKFLKGQAECYAINPEVGGAYFVPVQYPKVVDSVVEFCRLLGKAAGKFPVPVRDEDGDRSVADAIVSGLITEVEALKASVEAFDPSKVRDSTITKKVEAYQKAKFRLEGYKELLAEQASKVDSVIAEAQADLSAKILVIDAVRVLQGDEVDDVEEGEEVAF